MAFSDSIDADMLLTGIRFMRESTAQNASGDYVTAATTIAHTVKGDIQPMQPGFTSYMATQAGGDYELTHRGFFDVPDTLPVEGDKCIAGTNEYQVRNCRDFKTHLELDMERLGQ
tara:strand:+ start:724 stop:1068 length:345 start_codon:yes stop_codon:yes gene_type:complete